MVDLVVDLHDFLSVAQLVTIILLLRHTSTIDYMLL